MSEIAYLFEPDADDAWLQQIKPRTQVSVARLLMRWEDADELLLEAWFSQLEEKDVTLDVTDLSLPASAAEAAKRLAMEQKLAQQGLRPEQLEQTDPLRLYLEELAQIPVCGDPCLVAHELAEANRKGIDAEALRESLVNLSLSRVVELAARYTGKGVLLLDLIQEGSIGLWRATEGFRGDGADFETFRDRKIQFYLGKAVFLHAHESGIGQKMRTAAQDYRSVDERLLGELGRNPTLEEIAQALHMTLEETAAVAKMLENARLLNSTLRQEPENLPQEEDQTVEDTAYFRMRQRIGELLSALPESDAKLLSLRYGLEGGIALDPQQTAARLGMTADEVIAREAAALSVLRQKS